MATKKRAVKKALKKAGKGVSRVKSGISSVAKVAAGGALGAVAKKTLGKVATKAVVGKLAAGAALGAKGAGLGALAIGGAKVAAGAALVGGALYGAEQLAEKLGVRGGRGFVGGYEGQMRKRKRINVANSKAAKRAVTRIKGMRKLLSDIEKTLPRRPAKATRGVITAQEAARALRN